MFNRLMEKLDDTISRKVTKTYVMHGIAREGGNAIKKEVLATSYKDARNILSDEISSCMGVVIYKRTK